MEDEDVKLVWDINIQCDIIEPRRPNLILVDKKEKSSMLLYIPGDSRIREKEIEKIEKYQNSKRELKWLWSLKKVEVVPVVVGALWCIGYKTIVVPLLLLNKNIPNLLICVHYGYQ